MEDFKHTDNDGDILIADSYGDGEPTLSFNGHAVVLTNEKRLELIQFLTADGRPVSTKPQPAVCTQQSPNSITVTVTVPLNT